MASQLASRGAFQALLSLLCLTLAASMVWYMLVDPTRQRWRLRPEPAASSVIARLRSRQQQRNRTVRACSEVGNCSSFSRFNDSGGEWRVCTDGGWRPRPPCLAFAVGPDLHSDLQFALAFTCQVFNFDSPEHRPAAIGDGLWTFGRLNETGDSSGGVFHSLLSRLGASDHVVELLSFRLRPGADAAAVASWKSLLDDAIVDGSLDNVKQLLLQTADSGQPLKALVDRLAGAGFCRTAEPTDAAAEHPDRQQQRQRRPIELLLINVRFLGAPQPWHRNPPGSQVARPLEKLGLAKPLVES